MLKAVEQYDNIIICERKQKKMANDPNERRSNSEILKSIIDVTGALLAILAIIIGGAAYLLISITNHGNDIEDLDEKVEKIQDDNREVKTQIDELTDLVKDNRELLLDMSSKSPEIYAYNVELLNNKMITTVMIDDEMYLDQLTLETSYAIAKDWNGDVIYTAKELYNVPIITSYEEAGNEIYFYGQFNENGHWNGTCILNIYKDDILVSIFEGTYSDGVLFSYKRVAEENDDTWIITDRICQDDYNVGETFIYTKTSDYTKSFTQETVRDKQIATIDKFLASRKEVLLSYYNGRTSEGYYNDDTGDAYLVKYNDDGSINILYKGKFKDGQFNDIEGISWYIGEGIEDKEHYYYYRGTFQGGVRTGKTPRPWNPLTQDEINEVIKNENFKCPLNWKDIYLNT